MMVRIVYSHTALTHKLLLPKNRHPSRAACTLFADSHNNNNNNNNIIIVNTTTRRDVDPVTFVGSI